MSLVKLHTFLSLVVLILIHNVIKVSTNYPDETGGYSITVAYDEAVPEPSNGETALLLIENVKASLGTFSEKLWQASQNKFYIKSVDILVPSSWNGVNSSYSTGHKYDTAAIRLTSSSDLAHADNPFSCGKPGNFIQLPARFFSTPDGPYGATWKALLNLWASYRWGVHEEHGYIGNTKYPYSYRDVLTNEWQVTGCSDQAIPGSFMTLDPQPRSCAATDTLNSSSSCRFIPNLQLTNATTSLMHFHWIDSIVGFCDETNHDKFSPNRQNSLCDHKSVWEVIRDTRDYQIVTNPSNVTLPSTVFTVVQHSKKPSLYILLDRGKIQGSVRLANQIPRALVSFLGEAKRHDTLASVGTFPGTESAAIATEIDWLPVGENLDRFADVLGTLRLNASLQRNFPESILAAVESIKATAHPNGMVMLVVKYGADLSNFGNYVPESEIVQALTDQGIILNAIELQMTNHGGYSHLATVAKQTGGVYTVMSNLGEAATALSNVFWYMNNILEEGHQELKKNYRTILKTNVAPGSPVRFRVPKPSVNQTNSSSHKVKIHFSSADGELTADNFSIQGINTTGPPIVLDNVTVSKHQDWQESGSKWTYSLGISQEKIAPFSEVTIRINCLSCFGLMLIQTNVMNDASQNVTVLVYTNVDNPIIDLSRNDPIILFVKIFNSSVPVINAHVEALITDTITHTSSTLYFADDGTGSPDEEIYDGIYSQYFIPDKDGEYKISINVRAMDSSYVLSKNARKLTFQSDKRQRLLPIDQEMGCTGATCDNATLTGDFIQSIDLPINLQINNTANYVPEPTKIYTYPIVPAAVPEMYKLEWISPTVPGKPFISVASYECRFSTKPENLLSPSDFENQTQIPGISGLKPKAPGLGETFNVAQPSVTTFYAIRSHYRGQKSKISDIQVIEIRDQEVTSPITTTTTTTTTTTSSPVTGISSTTTSEVPPVTSTTGVTSSGDTSSVTPTTKKPWAKTGGGIAIITIAAIIVAAAILFGAFYLWKTCHPKRASIKINPPPEQPTSDL